MPLLDTINITNVMMEQRLAEHQADKFMPIAISAFGKSKDEIGISKPKGLINKNSTDWTDENKQKQALYTALHLIDWAQTRDLSRKIKGKQPGDTWHEQNPVLGNAPHQDKVDAYFALTGLAQLYLADKLSPKMREYFQNAGIALETGMINNNIKLGIKAKF